MYRLMYVYKQIFFFQNITKYITILYRMLLNSNIIVMHFNVKFLYNIGICVPVYSKSTHISQVPVYTILQSIVPCCPSLSGQQDRHWCPTLRDKCQILSVKLHWTVQSNINIFLMHSLLNSSQIVFILIYTGTCMPIMMLLQDFLIWSRF